MTGRDRTRRDVTGRAGAQLYTDKNKADLLRFWRKGVQVRAGPAVAAANTRYIYL